MSMPQTFTELNNILLKVSQISLRLYHELHNSKVESRETLGEYQRLQSLVAAAYSILSRLVDTTSADYQLPIEVEQALEGVLETEFSGKDCMNAIMQMGVTDCLYCFGHSLEDIKSDSGPDIVLEVVQANFPLYSMALGITMSYLDRDVSKDDSVEDSVLEDDEVIH